MLERVRLANATGLSSYVRTLASFTIVSSFFGRVVEGKYGAVGDKKKYIKKSLSGMRVLVSQSMSMEHPSRTGSGESEWPLRGVTGIVTNNSAYPGNVEAPQDSVGLGSL